MCIATTPQRAAAHNSAIPASRNPEISLITSAPASSTAAAVYGSAEDYDYENFSYSSGLDENGYWEGVKALDYVTLPENFAGLTFKRSEIEPTEEEVQSEIDSLLSDHATEKQVTDRAAADGDTVNIDYAGSVDGYRLRGLCGRCCFRGRQG